MGEDGAEGVLDRDPVAPHQHHLHRLTRHYAGGIEGRQHIPYQSVDKESPEGQAPLPADAETEVPGDIGGRIGDKGHQDD